MAESFYKNLHPMRDVTSTRTLLHEAIPLTGTIVSGTYNDENIKNYAHGMFQSVYDYPYLSSSANHIFDITVGVSTNSDLYANVTSQQSKKRNIYNQMAQVLVGHDETGSVKLFDQDGISDDSGTKFESCFFINLSRLLIKDEIKKGTFSLEVGVGVNPDTNQTVFNDRIIITDKSGSDGYFVNSPVGEYGILYATASATSNVARHLYDAVGDSGDYSNAYHLPIGHIYYQAGVIVLTASLLTTGSDGGFLNIKPDLVVGPTTVYTPDALKSHLISGSADWLRRRIYNLQFNNTVELNSTVYFCRVNHNDFNYSTNPTYTTGSKIRVKTKSTDTPVSYITTVGLYNDNNEMLACAKVSEPLKKDSSNEFTLRVRLDY